MLFWLFQVGFSDTIVVKLGTPASSVWGDSCSQFQGLGYPKHGIECQFQGLGYPKHGIECQFQGLGNLRPGIPSDKAD